MIVRYHAITKTGPHLTHLSDFLYSNKTNKTEIHYTSDVKQCSSYFCHYIPSMTGLLNASYSRMTHRTQWNSKCAAPSEE